MFRVLRRLQHTNKRTVSVHSARAGRLDMFCLLLCVCFLLHCKTLLVLTFTLLFLTPHCHGFPLFLSLIGHSQTCLFIFHSSLIFFSDAIPLIILHLSMSPTLSFFALFLPLRLWHPSTGTDPHPQGVHLPRNTAGSSPSTSHPPPFICHPPPTSSTSILWIPGGQPPYQKVSVQ